MNERLERKLESLMDWFIGAITGMFILAGVFMALALTANAQEPTGNITLPTNQNWTNITIKTDINPIETRSIEYNITNAILQIDNTNLTLNVTFVHNQNLKELKALGRFESKVPAFNITLFRKTTEIPEHTITGNIGYFSEWCIFNDLTIKGTETQTLINKTSVGFIPCKIQSNRLILNSSDELKKHPIIIKVKINNQTYDMNDLSFDLQNISLTIPVTNGTYQVTVTGIRQQQQWNFTVQTNYSSPTLPPKGSKSSPSETTPQSGSRGHGSPGILYKRDTNYTTIKEYKNITKPADCTFYENCTLPEIIKTEQSKQQTEEIPITKEEKKSILNLIGLLLSTALLVLIFMVIHNMREKANKEADIKDKEELIEQLKKKEKEHGNTNKNKK